MSKMSNAAIREAESRSLDNAEEVRELRAEVANRDQVIGNLMAENAKLRKQLGMTAERGKVQYRGSNGRWYDTPEEAAGAYSWSSDGRERP